MSKLEKYNKNMLLQLNGKSVALATPRPWDWVTGSMWKPSYCG